MSEQGGEENTFQINDRDVATHAPPLIIGEIAQAHDGSLGMAHAYIDAVADSGAHAVKFQTHIADQESSNKEKWRVKFSRQDETRQDYWRRMEFSPAQWANLKSHAEKRGLIFLSSAFSRAAVDLLSNIGMPAWKIASGEVNNECLMEYMLATRKPILLSSGMSTLPELDFAVDRIKEAKCPYAVLQCSSSYPTDTSTLGLNLIDEFADRFNCPVGLSDHSGTIYPSLGAVALGASLIEIHVTFDKKMFGPDVESSITLKELSQVVQGSHILFEARRSPVNKNISVSCLKEMRSNFQQSLIVVSDMAKGSKLTRENLDTRKPCVGIPADEFNATIGRRINKGIKAGEFISHSDLEPIQ